MEKTYLQTDPRNKYDECCNRNMYRSDKSTEEGIISPAALKKKAIFFSRNYNLPGSKT